MEAVDARQGKSDYKFLKMQGPQRRQTAKRRSKGEAKEDLSSFGSWSVKPLAVKEIVLAHA